MAKTDLGSLGGGAGALLFKGVLYLLYGTRAGETETEKTVRAGVIIIFLIALFLALRVLTSLIRGDLFVERAERDVPRIEWEMPAEMKTPPSPEEPSPYP